KLDQAKANFETDIIAAQANVAAAKARVTDAQIDLSYCRMSSPIDGRIGLAKVKMGNLVGPATAGGGSDYAELAEARQSDQIAVGRQGSARYPGRVTELPRELQNEVFKPGPEGEDARQLRGKAKLTDNAVEPTPSTFKVQAEVATPEKALLP